MNSRAEEERRILEFHRFAALHERQSMITDEMVGIAENAYDSDLDVFTDACDPGRLRAALEAVAPLLIAAGMREAAEIATVLDDTEDDTHSPDYWSGTRAVLDAILARAQELDPK